MELTILEILYIALIAFLGIIGALLTLVLVRVMRILGVVSEVTWYYTQVKSVIQTYGNVPAIFLQKMQEKMYEEGEEEKK